MKRQLAIAAFMLSFSAISALAADTAQSTVVRLMMNKEFQKTNQELEAKGFRLVKAYDMVLRRNEDLTMTNFPRARAVYHHREAGWKVLHADFGTGKEGKDSISISLPPGEVEEGDKRY